MITFKQQITVSEELVQGMAHNLGWHSELHTETPEEYVAKKAKEYMTGFFIPFGEQLVAQQLSETKEQLEQAIIEPVKNALISEVVISE